MMELQGAEDAIVLALGLLEAAPDAILVIRPGGTIALANRMAERVFGYDRAELIGMPVESLVPQEHRHDHGSKRARYEQSGRTRTMGDLATLDAVRKSGDTVPVEISLSPVETSIGKLTIAIVRDATRRRATEAELRHAGTHDALTGLFNRAYVESVRPSLEASKQAVGVLIIDLDDLKGVNDTLGHEAGDQFIKRAAVVLRATAAPDDVPARLGGDEFAMLVPHADAAVLDAKVALLREEQERHNEVHRGRRLEFSVGAALTEARGGIALAMRVADRRMYEDKQRRRPTGHQRSSRPPQR
ncbi:MAG: diguanylate cyclase [Sandaracinaceae bacterium]|jgi:diguanylate cyclase (GGDEF)-like protein/PAS domain S-box-containing protein|nr:diguanylate cyclase [Sandaracinaceae bacterium]MBK8409204.1 diguanylate cyclase [Sandaracinaceae bacterium]MBK8593013.1 diguanylate cyclase [Sandaracinaceae bacterium]